MAALPNGSEGTSDGSGPDSLFLSGGRASTLLSSGQSSGQSSGRLGIRLKIAKNTRLRNGAKNKTTNPAGSFADLSLRSVIDTPTQTNGIDITTMVARNLASLVESVSIRIASVGGIQ